MADKIYCYPDTDILINKLDIQNSSQLIEAETRIASIRLYQLQKHPVKGNFDFKHLCNIHNHIFRICIHGPGSCVPWILRKKVCSA